MHTIGCSWSHMKVWEEVHVHTRQKKTYRLWSVSLCVYWVRVGCNVMPVCLACHCLVACIAWPSIRQSLRVSQLSVTACGLPKYSASEFSRKHDWMHRIGSRRWLELATACSDPPTDAQLQCPCTFLYKFCVHCRDRAACSHGSMWWAWFIAHSWLCTLNERGNLYL